MADADWQTRRRGFGFMLVLLRREANMPVPLFSATTLSSNSLACMYARQHVVVLLACMQGSKGVSFLSYFSGLLPLRLVSPPGPQMLLQRF